MPAWTEQMTQELAIMDIINSATLTNTTVQSALGIDMSKVNRAMYIVFCSSYGAAGLLNAGLQSCSLATFASGVHTLANVGFATAAGSGPVAGTLEIRSDQVTQQFAGDRYIRLNLTGSGNVVTMSAIGIGAAAEQSPAGANYGPNATYVNTQVVCST